MAALATARVLQQDLARAGRAGGGRGPRRGVAGDQASRRRLHPLHRRIPASRHAAARKPHHHRRDRGRARHQHETRRRSRRSGLERAGQRRAGQGHPGGHQGDDHPWIALSGAGARRPGIDSGQDDHPVPHGGALRPAVSARRCHHHIRAGRFRPVRAVARRAGQATGRGAPAGFRRRSRTCRRCRRSPPTAGDSSARC